MNTTREFIIDCISRDDFIGLEKLSARHIDSDVLAMQIPYILRACRDLEAITGQDRVDYIITSSQARTLLALSDFVSPACVLLNCSNLPLINNKELSIKLLKRMEAFKYGFIEVKAALRKAIRIGQVDVSMSVLEYFIEHKGLDVDEAYEMYEECDEAYGLGSRVFEMMFKHGIAMKVIKAGREGELKVSDEFQKSFALMRIRSASNTKSLLTNILK